MQKPEFIPLTEAKKRRFLFWYWINLNGLMIRSANIEAVSGKHDNMFSLVKTDTAEYFVTESIQEIRDLIDGKN